MSFKPKIDFCGLSDGTSIIVATHSEGRSKNTVTCENDSGDTTDATQSGQTMSPSNTYKLKADLTNYDIVLGKITTVNLGTQQAPVNKYFALRNVAINTSNSGEVTISAQSEEVPSATQGRTYTVTIASLKCRVQAQIINSLFSLTGEKVHLQSANYTFSVEFHPTTVDNERVTYDIYGGKIVCALDAKQAGSEAPGVTTTAENTEVRVITNDPSEERPDGDYAHVAAEVTQYLTADAES